MGDGKSDISLFGSAESTRNKDKEMEKKGSSMAMDDRVTDLRVDLEELKKEVERLDRDKLDKDDFEMMLEKFNRGRKEDSGSKL